MNLIDEVLEAQAEFERRKAAYQAHPSQHAQEDEYEAQCVLEECSVRVAPKLARAYDRLKKEVVRMSYDKHRKTEVEILEMLAEIEKELAE